MNTKEATPATLMIAATAGNATPMREAARPLDTLLGGYLENRSLHMMGPSGGARS